MTATQSARREARTKKTGLLRLRQEIPDGIFATAGFIIPALILIVWWAITWLGLVKPLFFPAQEASSARAGGS